jgi:hypothetical protein
MGSYTFKWDHTEAEEVFVTGTFDNWSKSIKLEKTGSVFEKTVELPNEEKILYKFVVDGKWTTNETAPQETDDHNNTNNVLHPSDIVAQPAHSTNHVDPAAVIMSSAAPHSTTAELAKDVPLEPHAEKAPESAAISSAAPGSTTAELAKNVPLETPGSGAVPGGFPETPLQEPQEFSVKPIPASSGPGNPIHLEAGQKVPDASTFTTNTVQSTVTTDKESYEKGGSDPAGAAATESANLVNLPPITNNLIPESSLPISVPGIGTASERATTESVPDVVKESQTEASAAPEASSSPEAVKEKQAVEKELLKEVKETPPTSEGSKQGDGIVAAATGAATAAAGVAVGATTYAKEKATEATGKARDTTSTVPEVVTESIKESQESPEATTNPEAVTEKKEVETELLKEIKKEESAGEPAPAITAALSETAPAPISKDKEAPAVTPTEESASKGPAVPPKTPEKPATTAASSSTATPAKDSPASTATADKKHKKRASIFGRLKERFSSKDKDKH